MIDNILEVRKDEIHENVQKMLDEGYRFITMSCVDLGEEFDILYHFGKDYEMHHIRIRLSRDEELESISKIFFCAVLVENEIKDLFGIKIRDIVIDYDGRLLLSEGAPFAPMCNRNQIEIEVRGEEK